MKKILFPLLLACCAPLNAEDCAKSTDACSAGSKIVSPFLAAAAQPLKAAPLPAAEKKPAPVRPVPQVPAAPVQAAAPVAELPAAENTTFSSPLWLLVVGAGFAGLYFYLGGKKKRGKRR